MPQSPQTTVTVPFTAAQTAGDLNVVVVGWNSPSGSVVSVADTKGNQYLLAVGPTVSPGFATQAIYYAANIAAAAANANSVTVTFAAAVPYPDIRIAEYRGLATASPVDGAGGAHGSGALGDSGPVTTINTNDLLVGANMVSTMTSGPGLSFTSRIITSQDGDILEDRTVAAAGTYNATAPQSSGEWIMQMVAFKAAVTTPDTQPPTAPTGLTANATSSTQVTLAWTAATDNVGVTNYLVERCQGSACASFAQIGTSATTGYTDSTASASTSYSYRVRATDAAVNLGPYSNTANATTPAPPDTQPPTAPTVLTANATSPTLVTLAWTASTDNVGVTNYLVERCQGATCSNFAQVGTSATTGYTDNAVVGSTSYKYRVRATDAASNLSPYSNTAAATTPAPPDTQPPTAPAGLGANAPLPTQVTLAWTASTDNVGVTNYLVERCQGTGCASFAQIGTSATVGYTDNAVVASTPYSYRVRATDAANNLSGFSNTASVTTPAAPDTQPPTAPSGLTATTGTTPPVTLAWTASTDNVGVTNYLIERCQGTGCTSFAQIGTSPTAGYTDATTSPATTYNYRVRATDAASNLSPYSNTAGVTTPAGDTQPPTAPTNLSATVISSSQINLSWTASTDNVGVTSYLVERCQGTGCTTFAQVGSAAGTTFNNTGLTAASSYSYRVRATDAASNLSGYSNTASATTLTAAALAFVQVNSADPQSSLATVTVPFTAAQTAGNFNVVVVGWNNATGQVATLTDTKGNQYLRAVGPTIRAGFAGQSIYYAANIAAAAAGANSVTVTFSAAVPYPDIRIAEYSGIAAVNPVDAAGAGQGTGVLADSGPVVTINPNDLLVAANMVSTVTSGPGASFTGRVITNPDGDILEDRTVGAAGTYNATAPLSSGQWIMQLVAFKAAVATPDTQPPTAPANLTGTAFSGTQIDLSWTASVDNVGVATYRVERCLGSTCADFAEIGAPSGTSTTFSDTGVVASTTYSYRVRATDAAGNFSPYSNTVTTTSAAPDTVPPSAPGTLTATAISGTQINVSWGAATDNVGVAGYRLERCQGVGCTAFTKFGTTITGTSYSDVGLAINTSYSYIVRAQDAAGNLGPYSNVASATTLATNPHLVAAFSFDEGVGTTVTDLSGHGNNGTISNATWTTSGKFGKALVFNGTNALVTVPDAPSLRLTTGMSLEAWVNPAVVNSGWRDIIYKGADNYYLEGSGAPSGGPAVGVQVGTAHGEAYSPTNLATGAWTFLAATYDGTIVRLYMNGTQVATQSFPGTIANSTNALQIGGDSIWGQFFHGTIDEVRVYDVTLSPGQIQADMATAVGGSSAALSWSPLSIDFGSQSVGSTSAVRLIGVSNGGTLALNITSITISGAQASDFAQTSDCIRALAPADSCTINVTFTPLNGGARSATLVIANNAPGNPHSVPLSGTAIGFTLTPQTTILTPGRTQQFTNSGAGGSPVNWSVDNVVGGTPQTGTITSTGLYTAPSTAGTHAITVATTDGTKSVTGTAYVTANPGMFTHHNDNARTGQNLQETVLTFSNVNSTAFGKLASYAIDGIAHASPLYVANVNIPGLGLRNVVYVATEHDSVYAFDADGGSPTPLWHVSFINPAAGITTVPNTDTGECCDIAPEIGITGTPAIDPSTGTLYVVVKTKEGAGVYRQRLHAMDIATGAEKFGGPVLIQASVPGNGTGSANGQLPFDSLHENQRTALLLHNGIVYFGFGSHGDFQPYHGWILGYNATTLQRVFVFVATPNGEGGGIWQSGGGLAIDSAGNFYFATGDGTFNVNTGGTDYGDTFVKLNPAGAVVDYFTPSDQASLDSNNLDLDAGGMILLPDQLGTHPHLLVSAGKDGTIYVVDRDNMSHFNPTNQNVQTLQNIFPFGTPLPGNYSSPVYFNGSVYFAPVSDVVQAFRLTNGLLSTSASSTTGQIYPYPGAALSISANGTANGILWAVLKNGSGPGTLHAYDASNLAVELYNSDQAGTRDTLDVAAKFSIPLVINGRVYVASEGKLTIYGLLP